MTLSTLTVPVAEVLELVDHFDAREKRVIGARAEGCTRRRPGAVGSAARDATGGGGWGPVVTSNLLARGAAPAKVVGTVNLAEFFVTAAVTVTFIASLGPNFGKAALGLVIGGVFAAPIAAFGAKRLPRRTLTALVGATICGVSAYGLWSALA